MNNIVTIIKGLLNNSISHLGTDDGYNKTKLIPAIIPTLPITCDVVSAFISCIHSLSDFITIISLFSFVPLPDLSQKEQITLCSFHTYIAFIFLSIDSS